MTCLFSMQDFVFFCISEMHKSCPSFFLAFCLWFDLPSLSDIHLLISKQIIYLRISKNYMCLAILMCFFWKWIWGIAMFSIYTYSLMLFDLPILVQLFLLVHFLLFCSVLLYFFWLICSTIYCFGINNLYTNTQNLALFYIRCVSMMHAYINCFIVNNYLVF